MSSPIKYRDSSDLVDVSVSVAKPLPVTGGGVVDSTGAYFNPDNLAQTLTYNGDGTVATIAATDGANTWTQTFTYTSGNLTGISKWVKA